MNRYTKCPVVLFPCNAFDFAADFYLIVSDLYWWRMASVLNIRKNVYVLNQSVFLVHFVSRA